MTCTVAGGVAWADCTCRAGGRDYELGRTACLSTPQGLRLATCGMALNNTSWRFTDTPCVGAALMRGEETEMAAATGPPNRTAGVAGGPHPGIQSPRHLPPP